MRWTIPFVGLLLTAGCLGTIGGDGDAAGAKGGPGGLGPQTQCGLDIESRAGMRLTSQQYVASLWDLFGDAGFDAELENEPGLITKRAVRQLRDGAAAVVSRRGEWTEDVFPCDTSGAADTACVDAFIDGFGAKVFRRPLTDDERTRLRDSYDSAAASPELDFDGAMEVLLQVMLQSPAFIYLFEDGVAEATDDVRLLTDHEVAARLSYFLWGSTPDTSLMDAAAAGELSTVEGLVAAAERMIASDKAKNAAANFMAELLQLNGGQVHYALQLVSKDPLIYPEVDAALLAAMRSETDALVARVMFDGSGQFDELFTSREAYVNGPLATLYGVDNGPADADTWQWVTLEGRSGILTRAAFLATYATATVHTSDFARRVDPRAAALR